MNLKSAQHLVNGTWHATGTSKHVTDPGNGSTVGEVVWGTAGDATRRAYHQTATLASVTASTQGQEVAAADASRVPAIVHHSGA